MQTASVDYGKPEKLTPVLIEVLGAVIAMPGCTNRQLLDEYSWNIKPTLQHLEHRVIRLEEKGLVSRVRTTLIPTNYPTGVGEATYTSLAKKPRIENCITCKKAGKTMPVVRGRRFCKEHTELFARLRQEIDAEAERKIRPGTNYKCKNPDCDNPRPRSEDFCIDCREEWEQE